MSFFLISHHLFLLFLLPFFLDFSSSFSSSSSSSSSTSTSISSSSSSSFSSSAGLISTTLLNVMFLPGLSLTTTIHSQSIASSRFTFSPILGSLPVNTLNHL
ncbi:MAG TPA: hypothetical protein EYP32_03400 [Aquificaceae bacterium]|nr:hypothetical protein [Aquificaceae bacterium]